MVIQNNKEWNSFKRIDAVFNHETPDRVPIYELSIEIADLGANANGQETNVAIFIFPPEVIGLLHDHASSRFLLKRALNSRVFRAFLSNLGGGLAAGASKLHTKYDLDMFLAVPGIPMIFKYDIFKNFYTDEARKIVYAPDGRVVFRVSPNGAHTRHGFLQSPEDWEKYVEFDVDHPANWMVTKSIMKKCKKIDIVPLFQIYGGGCFEDLSGMFGFEKLFYLMVKDKAFLKKAIKEMNDYAIGLAEKVMEQGGKYFQLPNDLGYKGRSIISPKMFREFFKPGITKVCNKVHEYGGKVTMHSDGYIMDLLPDIAETGLDSINPIERQSGMEIAEIQKQYKDLVLIGNVPIPILTHGTPKETSDYVKELLRTVSSNGNHIVSSSHSVTPKCKAENFIAYVDAVHQYGKYPINITD